MTCVSDPTDSLSLIAIVSVAQGQLHLVSASWQTRAPLEAMQLSTAAPVALSVCHPPTRIVVGGIIPDEDAAKLLHMGVARVYTPKDFELNRIMMDIVALADPVPEPAE